MTSRQLRLVRGMLVSSAATLIAAVSHTLGGGAAPHPLLIAALGALLTGPTAALVGSRRSRIRVAGAVLVAQAAFHGVFAVLGSPTASRAVIETGHAHHADALLPVAATHAPSLDATMLGAHLAAAAVTTLLVWRAEAVARAIVSWFRLLAQHHAALVSPDHPRPVPLRSIAVRPLDRQVAAAVSRRGPPPVLGG